MDNRSLAAVLAVCILLAAGFLVVFIDNDERIKEEKWYNVDIIDNVYPSYSSMSLQDNYYAYVNDAYYIEGIESGSKTDAMDTIRSHSVGYVSGMNIENDITAIFEGAVAIEDLGDADVLEAYGQFNFDMESRDAIGVDVIRPYVIEIDSISTLEEMTEYIVSGGSAAMYRAVVDFYRTIDEENGENIIILGVSGLPGIDRNAETVSEEQETQRLSLYRGMLDRFDDIDTDAYMKAIETINSEVVNSLTNEFTDVLTYSDLEELDFPFAENLRAYHEAGIELYIGIDQGWMDVLDDYYTADNLMLYKSMVMYSLLLDAVRHLDSEAYSLMEEVLQQEYDPYCTLMRDADELISMLIGKYYTNAYTDDDFVVWFDSFVTECKEAAKEYYRGVTWIGQETKDRICEKIDKMAVRALSPMGEQLKYFDYSGIEADSYYELIVKIREGNEENAILMASEDLRAIWDPDYKPTDFNMFYGHLDNSLNLMTAYVREFMRQIDYDYEGNREYVLGTIGAAICHEIGHAFDKIGCNYTPYGIWDEEWLFTPSERETFESKVGALTDYITGFYVGNDEYLHEDMIREVMSDMCGSAIASTMLKSGDVPERFFEALVSLEFDICAFDEYYAIYVSSEHPPPMYRLNMEVQQLKLFYDIYGIKEGDNMFLAVDKRVNVW